MAEPTYLFTRGERGIFAEVYFPKKVAYQGTIFTALEEGYDVQIVKTSLEGNANQLLDELAEYPGDLFDPYQYGTLKKLRKRESKLEKAKKRIAMYASPFKGWSMYEVDGMFFPGGKIHEERTQVIRLMFRFESGFAALAKEGKCEDVLRSILYFVIETRGHVAGEKPWDAKSKRQFFALHKPWRIKAKQRFAERHFSSLAKEAMQWVDDCALFVFGYLVREFSQEVLETKRLEDEIWVTSFFDLTLNVIRKSNDKTTSSERKVI